MSDLIHKAVAVAGKGAPRLFLLVGTAPYTRLDGTQTELALWEGRCRRCGSPFIIATPMITPETFRLSSKAFGRCHCDIHKRGAKK